MLHITQPAVLSILNTEELYECKLVTLQQKHQADASGELLKQFATTVFSDAKHLKENILFSQNQHHAVFLQPPCLWANM